MYCIICDSDMESDIYILASIEDDGLRDHFLLPTHTGINVATQLEGEESTRGSMPTQQSNRGSIVGG